MGAMICDELSAISGDGGGMCDGCDAGRVCSGIVIAVNGIGPFDTRLVAALLSLAGPSTLNFPLASSGIDDSDGQPRDS